MATKKLAQRKSNINKMFEKKKKINVAKESVRKMFAFQSIFLLILLSLS